MHILRYLHLRVSELLLLQHHGSQGGDKRGEGTYLGQLFQPFLHSGDLRSQSASQQAEPFPQSLQSQVLVFPREVRQPALLRLWALHYPLPGADRPPGGRTGDGFSPVSYTHLRAHETKANLVCRLLLEKKKTNNTNKEQQNRERTRKRTSTKSRKTK